MMIFIHNQIKTVAYKYTNKDDEKDGTHQTAVNLMLCS